MTSSRFLVGVLLILALLASVTVLSAQSRARIRVALIESLSSSTSRAEILRFASPTERDLILLPAGAATAKDLAVALTAYRALKDRAPAAGGRVGRTSITAHDSGARLSPAVMRRADEMLRRVQAASESRIGNLGRGRWEEFDVQP